MKYLVIFLATTLSLAIGYLPLSVALSPSPISAEYWVREMIVIKHNIVGHYKGKKKIVIAAGSNALFGIDTKQLGKELKIPVINFGLHRGLSLENILDEAASVLEHGDVVVLPLEANYYCEDGPTDWQARNNIAWNREQWASWPYLEKIKGASLLYPTILYEVATAKLQAVFWPETIKERLIALDDRKILKRFALAKEPDTFAYSAFNLDSMGNMEMNDAARYFGTPDRAERADTKIDICPKSWQLLSSFKKDMNNKGVKIYFANTPYVYLDDLNIGEIEATSKLFIAKLSEIAPVLDTKSELVFDRKLFFDTDLHLNTQGRKLRTEMLASSILHNSHLSDYINNNIK